MKHFTKITDLTKDELIEVLSLSQEIHAEKKSHTQKLSDKNVLFCFEKPSLRTLVGTESALNQLGASVIHSAPEVFLGGNIMYAEPETQNFGEREALKDTVKNIEQFCDAIFTRVFSHETIVHLASISAIPVVNALCDSHHPMQALADMLTIQDVAGETKDLKIAFIGDANNVAFSLFQLALILGYECAWAGPAAYNFSAENQASLVKLAHTYGGKMSFSHDAAEAAKGAQFIYADTFISMGEEAQHAEKLAHFSEFQINSALWNKAPSDAKFMHCLPAHRGVEVTDEIIDGPQSVVCAQAKNRMVSAKGLFGFLLA